MKRTIFYPAFLLLAFWTSQNAMAGFRLTENKGQWDSKILFRAELNGVRLYVGKNELTYLFYDSKKLTELQHSNVLKDSVRAHLIKVQFDGANANPEPLGLEPYSDYANFFKGRDPSRWKGGVKSYARLYIRNLYPDTDFELYEDKGRLKYNFILRNGASSGNIRVSYHGADSMKLQNSELQIFHRFGYITELKPLVYEESGSEKRIIPSAYHTEGNTLSFALNGKRRAGKTLVIDPVLVFSTYSGSLGDNFGYTATFDSAGHGYAGGTVFDFGFPSTAGAFQMVFSGGDVESAPIGYTDRDCGIMKFSSDGKSLVYATYIGGGMGNEQPHSMVVDKDGNLLIMGTTKSDDFPTGSGPSFSKTRKGLSDIFVVKLSADGTALLSGTYLGGSGFDGLNGDRPSGSITPLLYNYADDFRGEILVDETGKVYIVSSTASSDFPLSASVDATLEGRQDGCLCILSPDLSSLVFSTFIGGNGDDAAYGLDFGTNNDLYVTGGSNSGSLGYAVTGSRRINNGGRADGFVLRVNLASLTFMSYTFLGTGSYDQTYFVKTDKYGKPFVFGQSEGNNTVSSGVYSDPGGKMFLKKLSVNLDAIELETVFGGSGKSKPDISPTALMVDECERIFISGWGGINFSDFPGGGTGKMRVTDDAYQKTTDNFDFYLAVFTKNFGNIQYATYFGGKSTFNTEAHEHVDGGTSRFDKKGIMYQSVCAGCGRQSLFPTTPGAWSNTNNSNNCNNALFKFDFENLNRKPLVRDSFYTVMAGDTLEFDITVSDPDLDDSLRVELQGGIFNEPGFPGPLPVIGSFVRQPGSNTYTLKVRWETVCRHAGPDTIRFVVKVFDRGCPTSDSNQAVISVLVTEPPVSPTPEAICLFFRDDGRLKISWDAFEKNKYFAYVLLMRKNPNGSLRILDTLFSTEAGEYTDAVPQNPRAVNYEYYMLGYNICGRVFDRGYRVSTTKESGTPIDSTYIHYATVFENRAVRLNWFKSKEEDFGSYDVYRTETRSGKSIGYRKIHTTDKLDDTTFTDYDADVSSYVYCYKIGVNDQCGHISKPSNEACNILLTGKTAHLSFDLDWTPYIQWFGGVRNYELQRRVDTGMLRYRANTGLLRVLHDDELDLWWGAYYYVVKAYEGLNDSGKGYNAQSLSNEIRLIQPPLVFVPSAFSPNNDYSNDVWGVSHAFVKEFRMQVYNRWGERVWDSDFKGTQWDGFTRGKSAMNDVFVWIVTYRGWDNKFYTQKGTVTVMP